MTFDPDQAKHSRQASEALPPPLPVTKWGMLQYGAPPVLPRVWPVFIAPTIMFALTLVIGAMVGVAIVIYQSVYDKGIDDDNALSAIEAALANPAIALPMILAISLMTGAIAIVAAHLSPVGIRRRLVLRQSTAKPFTMLLLCIGTVCVGGCAEALLIMLSKQLGLQPGGTLKMIEDMIRDAGRVSIVLTAIVIALGPGICEELLFRGYIQSRLHQRWGPRWAILIAAVMFAIVHADPMHSTLTFPLGAYMGWAAYRTGSTRTSIVCHIFNNLAVVILSTFPLPSIEEVSLPTLWFLFGIYLAIGFGCTLIAHYMLPPAPPPEEYIAPLEPRARIYQSSVYAGPTV